MEILELLIAYFAIAIALKILFWKTVLIGYDNPKIRAAKALILAILFGPSLIISTHAVLPATSLMALLTGVIFGNGNLLKTLIIFFGSVLISSAGFYGYYLNRWNARPEAVLQGKSDLSGVTDLVKEAHKQ